MTLLSGMRVAAFGTMASRPLADYLRALGAEVIEGGEALAGADFLIVEYRTDPDAVIALLPKELDPAADPGAVAAAIVTVVRISSLLKRFLTDVRIAHGDGGNVSTCAAGLI